MAPPPTVPSGAAARSRAAAHRDEADDADMADDVAIDEAEGADEMDEMEAFEADEADLVIDEDDDSQQQRGARNRPAPDAGLGGEFKCSVCDFTTRSRVTLQRHERLTHLKKKFFRCVKCNYVTHVKARYTKHVKYHSMPMIKCDLCEFRTPYKWNLDRHLKNHMGGGMYQCSLCNFTAHIKQSLTVHIQNHHLSPDKARSVRRRNKVGASDQLLVDPASSGADLVADADEAELLRLERMEHDDASPSALVREDEYEEAPENGDEPDAKAKKVQYKAKEPVNLNFLRPDDLVHKNGRVYVRNLPCSQCDFKAVWESELARHQAKMHGPHLSADLSVKSVPRASEPINYSIHSPGESQAPKKARPVPNLIPIAPSTASPGAPTILKIPQVNVRPWDESSNTSNSPVLEAVGLKSAGKAESNERKKKGGFLNELAQKLAGNVEAPAPKQEEASSAAGGSISISWSSRCQHCRQRCKTRADLLSHLKQCQRALQAANEKSSQQQPHPMENKVFVWNASTNASSSPDEESSESNANAQADTEAMLMMMEEDEAPKRPASVAGSDASEASLIGVETAPGIGAVTGGAGAGGAGVPPAVLDSRSTVRRVYRCPQCSFWATTASRFHVHMVGHTNTKPFECSQCSYRSNWRWDITKHIKLKAARDPAHTQARVLLLDASGERHYDQYDRYLVMMRVTESGGLSLTHGRFGGDDSRPSKSAVSSRRTESLSPSPSPSPTPSPVPNALAGSSSAAEQPFNLSASLASNLASLASALLPPPPPGSARQPPGLNALHLASNDDVHHPSDVASKPFQAGNPRRTIWKCKRCTFKDHNRETVLQHIRSSHYHPNPASSVNDGGHSASPPAAVASGADGPNKGDGLQAEDDATALTVSCTGLTSGGQVAVASAGVDSVTGLLPPVPACNTSPGSSSSTPAFRCGVCNQVSNWKHVIQRHCRLKHNGNIQVIENRVTDEDGPELSREGDDSSPPNGPSNLFTSPLTGPNGAQKAEKPAKRIRRDSPSFGDEDSMDYQGYVPQPDKGQYTCSTCPFVCKSLTEIEMHRQHHKPGPGRPIKCTLCSYFTADKHDLAQHLFLHGMHDLKLDSSGHLSSTVDKLEGNVLEDGGFDASIKKFRCDSCPFTSESKNQYVYHRQFHRPRGAPYKCPQCSYNVSRRHLLNQHLIVHNLPQVNLLADDQNSDSEQLDSEAEAEAEAAEAIEMAEEEAATGSSPPHCMTSASVSTAAGSADGYAHLGLDPNTVPRLPDAATVALPDIPLTWVSRGQKFYKMFKCRYCPHVNVRKANIQEHEKRHQTRAGPGGDNMHACGQCNYRCNNAGVLSAHVKVHQHILGIVHGLADVTKPDDEQLLGLAGVTGRQKPNDHVHREADESCSSISSSSGSVHLANQPNLDLLLGREMKISEQGLHFCAHCPARFLVETELLIHQRFHGANLSFRCDVCSYTARKENHLLAHWKVHSREYQDRTKVLIEQHGVSEKHPQPQILAMPKDEKDNEVIDLSSHAKETSSAQQSENWVYCPLCPAKFAPDSKALQYHSKLHGSNSPYRCRFCNYAVKVQDNLLKHEKLHLVKTVETDDSSTEGSRGASKRFHCQKCPSSFEKKEQFKVHLSLHGSQQRYRCDKCDYAVKYYPNYLQHIRKHEAASSGDGASASLAETESLEMSNDLPSIQLGDLQSLTVAERQHMWLQDKLRSKNQTAIEHPFYCQFCPFRCERQEELTGHSERHGVNGATGNYRCNFCDFTVTEQAQLSEHIGLHFQLKGRAAARLPESYWKCSNLEIWSEPVETSKQSEPQLVYDEKTEGNDGRADEDEDDDTLYIDMSTGQPLRDESNDVVAASEP